MKYSLALQEDTMSAIAGIINFNKEQINSDFSRNMMKSLEKFPANDIRVFQKDNVFLGCHAQWITPESIGEPLPFYDSVRQCVITADAIIDNREEIFEKLNIDKDKRKTMPDSQLILLTYYKWREECPKHLVGDFAFMIWDEREQKLFGARDFSGTRTLYYYQDFLQFTFCTVIQPFLSLPYFKKELNEQWLAEFLAISGVVDVVDTTITPYKGINQLPPSHSITIKDGRKTLTRYCQLHSNNQLQLKSSQEYIEAFQEVFKEAIKSRVRTHRGVGAHLSGGLDSGTVVSFAAKVLQEEKKQLHTYSYIPPKEFVDFTPKSRIANESPYINSTIQHVEGLNHHYLDFPDKNPFLDIDDFLETLEMPFKFFENSIWLKGIFETAQQENSAILLNGGRGNLTISWGPALEYYALLLKRFKWVQLHKELQQYSKNIKVKKSKIFPYIYKLAFPKLNELSPSIHSYQSHQLINPTFADKTHVYERLKEHGMSERSTKLPNIFEEKRRHFNELFHWNATNTLGTKLSLRYAVWKRDPTNDLRVIKFCLSVPEDQYVKNGYDRALIRTATNGYLPDKVRLNQHYRGVQGVDWVHRMIPTWNSFIEELEAMSNDTGIFEYLNEEAVRNSISTVKEGPEVKNAVNPDYRIAIRSLIVYRFIKKNF